MGLRGALGKLAYRNFILGSDIRPVLTSVDAPMFRGWRAGLVTSVESTDDVNITAGECRDATNAENIILASEITKKSDTTWAAGDDGGGLNATDFAADSDGLKPDTTYHVFLIKHTDGTVDAGLDKDTTATSLLADSGYTYYRRVGSVVTDATAAPNANLIPWYQVGNDFWLKTPGVSVKFTGETEDTARTVTLTNAPTGFKFWLHLNMWLWDTAESSAYISSLDGVDVSIATQATPFATISLQDATTQNVHAQVGVHSNTSAQFRVITNEVGVGAEIAGVGFALLGWHDDLGAFE
jgi:hypothetical protein